MEEERPTTLVLSSLTILLLLSASSFFLSPNCCCWPKVHLLLSSSSTPSPTTFFHPKDIIPLLPRETSWPLLRSLHSAVDLLPTFVGAASNGTINWKGTCFQDNAAWVEFHNNSNSPFGGATLHIKTSSARSWTCIDLYVFATPYHFGWDFYFLSREHKYDFKEWAKDAEAEYVRHNGISIFLLESGLLGTLQALWDVFSLFTNIFNTGESSNIAFLKEHMGATFEQRRQPWITNITVDDIHSGDFLAVSKIRGLWGGFETMEKWATGSFAGHTAVCLRDSEGKLWVGESGHENDKGENIIVLMEWNDWWNFELAEDDNDPHIALLPLHPDLRAKFNESAAWEYVRSMVGKPYGYHNMIFSRIDTTNGNYPPPLDAHLGLSLPELMLETEKRGLPFNQLLTIPEQDDWTYSDGKSASCVTFILAMYKEAGLFHPIASFIQVTEFTIKDAYTLKFFDDNTTRLPAWCKEADGTRLPFCQILGKYRMELPEYNTLVPYPHMNERCPSLPPDYFRPDHC